MQRPTQVQIRTVVDSPQPVVRDVTINHKEGLHTRPVMKFVDLAQQFTSEIRVTSLEKVNEMVNGKSAMELMLLGATCGTCLRIQAVGPDAKEAVQGLVELVKNRFGIVPDS